MFPYSANVGMRGVSPYPAGSRLRQQSMFGPPLYPPGPWWDFPFPNPTNGPWYGQSGNPIPFSTGPQALSPQFDFGGILNQLPTIIDTVSQLPGILDQITSLWPFLAGPQRMRTQALSPQFDLPDFSGIFKQVTDVVNTINQLTPVLSQIASLLPFAAGPQQLRTQALSPQFDLPDFSGIFKQVTDVVNTINQLTPVLSQIASLLPFAAGPQQLRTQALRPQFDLPDFSGIFKQVTDVVNTINQLTPVLSQIASLLPFAAGPQLRPQGFFGDLFGTIGAPLGGAIGGIFGNSDLGTTIGGLAGQLGRILPFSAGPQLSLAGAEPTGQANGAGRSKPILLPQSAVPPEVKTTLTFQNSLLQGAANEAVGNLTKAVAEAANISPETKTDLEALNGRALDFIQSGDYQKAIAQAYLGYYTLDNAMYRQRMQTSTSA
jgi:hypothetical protein